MGHRSNRVESESLFAIASALLQVYRLAVLLAIVWLIREHHLRLRVQGDRPITVAEVQIFLPDAHKLVPDASPRAGLDVFDQSGSRIGYAARTMPQSRKIVGYSGPTDGLVVFDAEDKVVGVAIRHSYDTPSHVEDVTFDLLFMESWNGRTWDEIAAITDLNAAEIYGVSGATRTSECLAQSISYRLKLGVDAAAAESGLNQVRIRWQDIALLLIVVSGCVVAFWKHPLIKRWQWLYSVAVFAVLGFVLGDLLAQSLLIGWAESGVPWRMTPGVVLLAAAAFLVPWGTRQPVYCQYICPHGHAQRWLMKWIPAGWKWKLPADVKWPAKTIPVLLLLVVLAVTFFRLPLDLAGIEPFDAYLLGAAGTATVTVAIVGLVFAAFIPMAYCKYGCPTGLLLDFVRRRGGGNRFEVQDTVALGFLLLAFGLYRFHEPIQAWIVSP